jgi:hypothetical protein
VSARKLIHAFALEIDERDLVRHNAADNMQATNGFELTHPNSRKKDSMTTPRETAEQRDE